MSVQKSLPLSFGHHVPLHHFPNDARDKAVAPRVGDDPATPLQLVERGIQGRPHESRRPADAVRRYALTEDGGATRGVDRKSTRLNSSHVRISYAVFCLKKKKKTYTIHFAVTRLYFSVSA